MKKKNETRKQRAKGQEGTETRDESKEKLKLPADVRDLVIQAKIVEMIGGQRECTVTSVTRELEKHHISRYSVSNVFKNWRPKLGLTVKDDTITLDRATMWFLDSKMYLRINQAYEAKQIIGRLVVDQIKELFAEKQLWLFLDAGTTTLSTAMQIDHNDIARWNTLTNNLWIMMHLLSLNSQDCNLPAGRADKRTAAIIQTPPRDLRTWFTDNPPHVSVIAFHHVQMINGGKKFVFSVDVTDEQATKIAGMEQATEVVFILADKEKLERTLRGTPTVEVTSGRWKYYTPIMPDAVETDQNDLKIKAATVYFCTDASRTDFPELRSLDEHHNIRLLCPP